MSTVSDRAVLRPLVLLFINTSANLRNSVLRAERKPIIKINVACGTHPQSRRPDELRHLSAVASRSATRIVYRFTGLGEKSCASQDKFAEEPKKSKAESSEAFGGLRNSVNEEEARLMNSYWRIISSQKESERKSRLYYCGVQVGGF